MKQIINNDKLYPVPLKTHEQTKIFTDNFASVINLKIPVE
jgi:hypothetical protein